MGRRFRFRGLIPTFVGLLAAHKEASMAPTGTSTEPLYSALGDDPDLREIVEMFVEEMPDRTSHLLDRMNAGDWEGLRRVAHQLKGAAGSYGFEPITRSAAGVEDAIRASRPEQEIRPMVEELVDLCHRAQAGPRPETY
jgi:HPt (histidine-containing phosphotransfer) domain-containing protein